ncbi:MAG: CoA-binding protein [Hyphomicrobiales bacterium]|nr:CoA-binding protein [Hyphomicrobiales bacterium]
MTIRNLDEAFRPKSIVLIGATERAGSAGATVMRNLQSSGFDGPIWLVNPKYNAIDGQKCFSHMADLPGTPDLGVIVTPPETVPGIITELGEKGAGAALVITAGITAATGLRQRMLEAAKPYGLRIIGPNSIGIFAPHSGLHASFAHLTPSQGPLAFVSQSGALVGAMLDWAAARHIGFSHVVSMGDMADVDIGDMLDYLTGDIHTRAILLYIEAITDPAKFMSAARSAARAKPVIAIKVGRHQAGAKAALTHTGALAGADDVSDAAMRRAGMLRVFDLEELLDAAETLTRPKPFDSDGLTIVTNGGGAGVLGVDKLTDFGGALTRLSEATLARLDKARPPTWSHGNPIDIIGDAGPERYGAAIGAALDDPAVGALIVMNCPTDLASSIEAAKAVLAC